MRKGEWFALMRKKQYVIAGSMVVIAAVGMTALYSTNQAKEREQLEQELAKNEQTEAVEEIAAEEESEASAASSVVEPEKKTDIAMEGTESAEIAEADNSEMAAEDETADDELAAETGENETAQANATSDTLHFAAEDGILWPMEGDVILNYSMDSTVYFATLDQYKYNPAVIISGTVNDKVTSVAKGQVSEIENSEVTGCTVKVDLGDGYEAIYGQLKEVNFAVGDHVEAGHVIGYIGEPTKYFSVEGSNLYFELRKDGIPIDPIEFFE